jgi:hypothetical protein
MGEVLGRGHTPPGSTALNAAGPYAVPCPLHEIKHDGFRVIAQKSGDRVRLYSRPGNDLTDRFSLIVEALARLRSRSCIIDGEAHPLPAARRTGRRWPVEARRRGLLRQYGIRCLFRP